MLNKLHTYLIFVLKIVITFRIEKHTLRFQINVRVQINVRAGQFVKINKCKGPNKHTGWKIWQKK